MNAPALLKYRGRLYRRAYTPPTPYNRSHEEVLAGVTRMRAALKTAQQKWPQLGATLQLVKNLVDQANRQDDPRPQFLAIQDMVEQLLDSMNVLSHEIHAGFGQAEYLAGK